MDTESKARWASGIGVLILLVLLIGQLWWYPKGWVPNPVIVWVVSMILIVLILGVIGLGFRKGFWGVLVNSANRYSLSQLQMILWTIVLIAAVVAYAVWRKHVGLETMGFEIPAIVMALLGLSTASLVGSPLIFSQKDPKVAPPREEKPLLLDLVTGEEIANKDTIDLSRVQMLIFTLIAVSAYAAALSAQMGDVSTLGDIPDDCKKFDYLSASYKSIKDTEALKTLTKLCVGKNLLQGFPTFSEGLLAIIAISHAGYLTLKAVNKK